MANIPKSKNQKQNRKSFARFIAASILNQFDAKLSYAESILNKLLPKTTQTQQTTDLVYGTIRNRPAIHTVINKFANCKAERIPNKILNIIRIGVYELIYCPHAAKYAVVNESVENTKSIAGKKQTAFVNAVLRQISSHITNRQILLKNANPKRTLPQTLNDGCEFDTDFLPDPDKLPADYLSAIFSLPRWLITGWLNEYGLENTRQICFASNRKPSIYLRPNTFRTTAKKLAEKLTNARIETAISENEMLKVKSPKLITKLPGFTNGLFSIQDLAAALPVKLLAPKQSWTILDLCAAPGSKSTQLAELTNDKAKIFATDIDSNRLRLVKENINRLKLKSIKIFDYEQLQKICDRAGKFNAVLLDVPCSNTGVLAKRAELRLRITKRAVNRLAETQIQLLQKASELINTNGKICYSTCSIQKQENENLIQNFLERNPAFKLDSEKLTLPSALSPDHDGGYVAILSKYPL